MRGLKAAWLVAILLVVALLAGACSDDSSDDADGAGATTTAAGSSDGDGSDGGSVAAPAVDACTLLTDDEVKAFGTAVGGRDRIEGQLLKAPPEDEQGEDGVDECEWVFNIPEGPDGEPAGQAYAVTAAVWVAGERPFFGSDENDCVSRPDDVTELDTDADAAWASSESSGVVESAGHCVTVTYSGSIGIDEADFGPLTTVLEAAAAYVAAEAG